VTETAEGRKGIFAQPAPVRTKLIEVALPLEAINAASVRENFIYRGNPSALHKWWAQRPLAVCRAILFSQLVDDPSAGPEEFPTEEAQEAERQRLFWIIEELVKWENSTNETVLTMARREIARSVARGAGIPGPETDADIWRILREHAPPVLDPFCGGGSIPLEAQRLGLEAHASDLNPVAVLITKALIEIPPRFAGQPPVNPRDRAKLGGESGWRGAAGLAADVRYYGEWMRDEAFKRIGHLYPRAKLPDGEDATVIAWLWARTVTCPNPACGARMPLVRSFVLSTKKGKETWVEPAVDRAAKTLRFEVRSGKGTPPEPPKVGRGAKFRCMVCDQIAEDQHIKDEARAGRMSQQLMAVVAEGKGGRIYLPPAEDQIEFSRVPRPADVPDQPLADDPRNIWCVGYGLDTFDKLFTPRQLVALTAFSDLVGEARERVRQDALNASLPEAGSRSGACYAEAIATYLAFCLDKHAEYGCTLVPWYAKEDRPKGLFARQAIPMVWDYAEVNPFANVGGAFSRSVQIVSDSIPSASMSPASVTQAGAMHVPFTGSCLFSTDPPYYDNISYADLSDFFFVWLRRSLHHVYPSLFRTMLTPKGEELVATPYRFGGDRRKAQTFFENGLAHIFERMCVAQVPQHPVTIYYAFKQAESQGEVGARAGAVSTGWETMLEALLHSELSISGTWPVRSERGARAVGLGTNALASSIVLVCRPRPANAPIATRREFIASLRAELPPALKLLTQGSIAAVDLAQAAIGPGMRVFSRYSRVIEAGGESMSVRMALALINQILYEVEEGAESEYDPDTRWAIAWYKDHGTEEGPFGEAETLSKAKDTSVGGLQVAGILQARAGKVRLLRRGELPAGWDPSTDQRLTVWEVTQHLIRRLEMDGERAAADLLARVGGLGDAAKDLAYALYLVAERKGWTEDGIAYNSLAVAWPEISRLAAGSNPAQVGLGLV
jgi:putative DNA methylase